MSSIYDHHQHHPHSHLSINIASFNISRSLAILVATHFIPSIAQSLASSSASVQHHHGHQCIIAAGGVQVNLSADVVFCCTPQRQKKTKMFPFISGVVQILGVHICGCCRLPFDRYICERSYSCNRRTNNSNRPHNFSTKKFPQSYGNSCKFVLG